MRSLQAIIVFASVTFAAATAHAASVVAVGTSDLTARCDFIFHGTALRTWTAAGPSKGSIRTYVEFSVADVLKGDRNLSKVTLSYLGGVLNGRGLRVEGLRLPRIGEEGVYFVERLGRSQVHPLYGWDQGRFLVREDADGRKAVFTHDRKPVRGFDQMTGAPGMVATAGHAGGVRIADDDRQALSLAEFKQRVRALVETRQ
jgi:hypothetical protein